jgi:NAD(P)-dependent dehydrogenase (short-subunit alcohol dehydrogenase family)
MTIGKGQGMAERKPRLEGKVAMVTGAGSSGPGVARERAKVLLVDRVASRAQETQKMIRDEGGESSVFEADVLKEEQAEKAVAAAVERYGKLDILHNNIGIGLRGSVLDVTEEDWDLVMGVNLKTMVFCSKYAVRSMMDTGGGSIINISSIAGMRGHGLVAYSASKGGVIALTRTMAVQHARHNIRVNCIAPGPVYTPMVAADMTEERRELRKMSVPLMVEGTAWDVGWAALYLASDESRWVTGVILPVDGGLSATSRQAYRR